jgi:hypothetical protein
MKDTGYTRINFYSTFEQGKISSRFMNKSLHGLGPQKRSVRHFFFPSGLWHRQSSIGKPIGNVLIIQMIIWPAKSQPSPGTWQKPVKVLVLTIVAI